MATDADVGLKPAFSDLFDVKAARVVLELLGAGWAPADFATAELEALRRVFAGRGVRLRRPLAGLLAAVATHGTQIAGLEAETGRLSADTQGAELIQIPGVGTVTAAGFVVFVGRTDRWSEWAKAWRAAGLDPARAQSGPRDERCGISREGSAWGRRAILDPAASVCRQPGRWQDGCQRRAAAEKPAEAALTAEGDSIGRTCFTMTATGADYDPDYETARASLTRKAGDRAA